MGVGLKDKAWQVERVDIRYDNGIAVRWNEKTAVTTTKQPIAQEHMAQKYVVKRFVMQEQDMKRQAVRELTIAPEKPGKV